MYPANVKLLMQAELLLPAQKETHKLIIKKCLGSLTAGDASPETESLLNYHAIISVPLRTAQARTLYNPLP